MPVKHNAILRWMDETHIAIANETFKAAAMVSTLVLTVAKFSNFAGSQRHADGRLIKNQKR